MVIIFQCLCTTIPPTLTTPKLCSFTIGKQVVLQASKTQTFTPTLKASTSPASLQSQKQTSQTLNNFFKQLQATPLHKWKRLHVNLQKKWLMVFLFAVLLNSSLGWEVIGTQAITLPAPNLENFKLTCRTLVLEETLTQPTFNFTIPTTTLLRRSSSMVIVRNRLEPTVLVNSIRVEPQPIQF